MIKCLVADPCRSVPAAEWPVAKRRLEPWSSSPVLNRTGHCLFLEHRKVLKALVLDKVLHLEQVQAHAPHRVPARAVERAWPPLRRSLVVLGGRKRESEREAAEAKLDGRAGEAHSR